METNMHRYATYTNIKAYERNHEKWNTYVKTGRETYSFPNILSHSNK